MKNNLMQYINLTVLLTFVCLNGCESSSRNPTNQAYKPYESGWTLKRLDDDKIEARFLNKTNQTLLISSHLIDMSFRVKAHDGDFLAPLPPAHPYIDLKWVDFVQPGESWSGEIDLERMFADFVIEGVNLSRCTVVFDYNYLRLQHDPRIASFAGLYDELKPGEVEIEVGLW